MSDCPSFDKALFDEYIANASSVDIDLSILKTCTETGGMKGGTRAKDIVKAIIYVLIAYLAASSLMSGDMDGVVRGLRMVQSGECNSIGSLAMSYVGLGNPVCEQYRRMLVLIPKLVANPGIVLACIGSTYTGVRVIPECIDLVARILTGDGDRRENIANLRRLSGYTFAIGSLGVAAITAGRRKVTRKRKSNRRRRESKHRSYRR